MAVEAGEENFFLFGLSADQVAASQGWYNPRWHYEHEPETRRALDMIASNAFSPHEPGIFGPIWDTLLPRGDHYMHLADLSAYVRTHGQVETLYKNPDAWTDRAAYDAEIATLGKDLITELYDKYLDKSKTKSIWTRLVDP